MGADYILIVAGIASSWITCTIIGGERQRLVQYVEAVKRAKDAANPPAEPAASPKKRSTPAPTK